MADLLRALPQIQSLLERPRIAGIVAQFTRDETTDALRRILARLRADILSRETDTLPDFDSADFADTVAQEIEAARAPTLRQVINATGILIHTNLGRARLAPSALQAMQTVGAAPSNLELTLDTGKRGSRHDHVEQPDL